MRRMTREEVIQFLDRGNWASICTVDQDSKPYAIEATYFLTARDRIGFMINPRGTTLKNISINPNVLLKITFTSKDLSYWLGISFFGIGRIITDQEQMRLGWEKLGNVMNADYSMAAEKFCQPGKSSPFLEIHVEKMSGQCSHSKNENINYNVFS